MIVMIISIQGCTNNTQSGSNSSIAKSSEDIKGSPETTTGLDKISIDELAKHNLEKDCWVTYKGEVYDITSFIPNHPGGPSVLIDKCGKVNDFETAFITKHGTSKIDIFMKVAKKIGILVQNA